MFDKIAEAILGNYPDNSQARELEILCRILALTALAVLVYLLLPDQFAELSFAKRLSLFAIFSACAFILPFLGRRICQIRYAEREKNMKDQDLLQKSIIDYNNARTACLNAKAEKYIAETAKINNPCSWLLISWYGDNVMDLDTFIYIGLVVGFVVIVLSFVRMYW